MDILATPFQAGKMIFHTLQPTEQKNLVQRVTNKNLTGKKKLSWTL